MEKTISHEALKKAIALYPTLRAFAGAMDVSYQVVQQWLINGVPAAYCPKIERLSDGKVRCEELYEDAEWGYLRTTVDAQHAVRRKDDPKASKGHGGRQPPTNSLKSKQV